MKTSDLVIFLYKSELVYIKYVTTFGLQISSNGIIVCKLEEVLDIQCTEGSISVIVRLQKKLFTKKCYISYILMRIYIINFKIKIFYFFYFKFISHLSYYIPNRLLYSIWAIDPNPVNAK